MQRARRRPRTATARSRSARRICESSFRHARSGKVPGPRADAQVPVRRLNLDADAVKGAVAIGWRISDCVAAADLARDLVAHLKEPSGRSGQEPLAARRAGERLQDTWIRVAVIGVEQP